MKEKSIWIPSKITTTNIFESDIERVRELMMDHSFLIKCLSGDKMASYEFTKEKKFDNDTASLFHFL